MAYSTITQLRKNVPRIDSEAMVDADVTDRITEADKHVELCLNNIIDFDLVPDITDSPATPDFINLLSQYKTAELCLVALYGAKREVTEVSDIQYWSDKFDKLCEQIKSGSITLELEDGTSIGKNEHRFTRDARPDIEPALGMDKYGEFMTDEELALERPERD